MGFWLVKAIHLAQGMEDMSWGQATQSGGWRGENAAIKLNYVWSNRAYIVYALAGKEKLSLYKEITVCFCQNSLQEFQFP